MPSEHHRHFETPAFAVIGPTCVGKTAYVTSILALHPVEVINLDSFQVFDHFLIGTGRADARFGARGHLYGIVGAEYVLSPEEYAMRATAIVHDIRSRGNIPLFEGGSISYLHAVSQRLALKMIGLAPPSDQWLRSAVERRIDSYDKTKLFDEIRVAQEQSGDQLQILRDDVVYLPAVEYLQGKISEETARARQVANLVKRARTQLEAYRAFPVSWIPADQPDTLDRIVSVIESTISASAIGETGKGQRA